MDAGQGELFPFLAPETVLAYCRQLERRILAIAPELSPDYCRHLLGELAITHVTLDRMERDITATTAYRQRQLVRPMLGIPEIRRLHQWPDVALERRRAPAWATRARRAREELRE